MPYRIAALAVLAVISLGTQGASLHKCRSSDGRLYYSDVPCPAQTETVHKGKLNSSDSDVPEPAPTPRNIETIRPQFAAALASLSGLRTAVLEHYMSNGKWPNHLLQMGFTPESMNSSLIDEVRMSNYEGEIEATLNKKTFGKDKKIVLTPKPILGGSQMEWQCATNINKQLLGTDMHPLCESKKLP